MKKRSLIFCFTVTCIFVFGIIGVDKIVAEEPEWYLSPPYNCVNIPNKNKGKCVGKFVFVWPVTLYFVDCIDDGGVVNPDCMGVSSDEVVEL